MRLQVRHILSYIPEKLIFLQNFKTLDIEGLPCTQIELRDVPIAANFREIILRQFPLHFLSLENLRKIAVARRLRPRNMQQGVHTIYHVDDGVASELATVFTRCLLLSF